MHSGSPATRLAPARYLAWTLAVVGAVVTASRWVDVAWSPLVVAQSLSPYAVALGLAGLVGALVPGPPVTRAALAGLCLAVVSVHAAIWAPWLTGEAPRAGRSVTVMATNLFVGQADAATVARQVRTHDVDVLVLTEATPSALSRLRGQGIARDLPYVVPDSSARFRSTVIRSRSPLTALPGSARTLSAAAGARETSARLDAGGRETLFEGVHLHPPTPVHVRQWRATLAGLSRWARQTRGPLIMAGDFNASVDHPGMRRLLSGGLRDAHEVAGAGRPPTWPRGKPFPAFVHIDHVLVRGLDVASAQEARIPGSDHDAVLVRLVVPVP